MRRGVNKFQVFTLNKKNQISTRSGRLFFYSKNEEILATENQLFYINCCYT